MRLRNIIKIYLANNGWFVKGNLLIIKTAFKYEFLDNAQDWVDIVFYLEENYKEKPINFYDTIYQFYINNRFKLFEDVIKRFEGFLVEND